MVSSETKMRVAQNCPGYDAVYEMVMMSMGSLAQSCDNCSNFVRGRCVKELFDGIRDRIRVN